MPRKKIGRGYFYSGIEEEFPLCCIFFFQDVWCGENRKFFREYCSTMDTLTDNGPILCPDCLVKVMKNKSKKNNNTENITLEVLAG